MYNKLLNLTWPVIFLVVCIDQGDGRWKHKDKSSLQEDIVKFKKLAEKIEHEIEAFYDEYTEQTMEEGSIDENHYKYLDNTFNVNMERNEIGRSDIDHGNQHPLSNNKTANISNGSGQLLIQNKYRDNPDHFVEAHGKTNDLPQVSDKELSINTNWPKFEDFLLQIGKKYDWKNDRWIKVKEKYKERAKQIDMVKFNFHIKHKFTYRTVKLNRNSKSKRNIVVAVTAVR